MGEASRVTLHAELAAQNRKLIRPTGARLRERSVPIPAYRQREFAAVLAVNERLGLRHCSI